MAMAPGRWTTTPRLSLISLYLRYLLRSRRYLLRSVSLSSSEFKCPRMLHSLTLFFIQSLIYERFIIAFSRGRGQLGVIIVS